MRTIEQGRKSDPGFTHKAVAQAYKTMTSKDVRYYEAIMKRLQHYSKLGIDHHTLNEVADFYKLTRLQHEDQLKDEKLNVVQAQRDLEGSP